MTSHELSVDRNGVTLAGTLFLPESTPTATVLMHPGSGPSDRDNDVFFPPIREHLLGSGFAVASFDKRGVGGSTGRWQDAGIAEQADDALACATALLEDEDLGPLGLFGHSQGGWVVVEAAGRPAAIAFVVTSSGPGVTPVAQERYAALTDLRAKGLPQERIDEAMSDFDLLTELARDRVPFEEARRRMEAKSSRASALDSPFVPDDEDVWNFVCHALDYDPRPALERISVPMLALFGADDSIVPVADSGAVLRAAVQPELLSVEIFRGAGHRVQVGNPPRMAHGYLETLSSFVADWATARAS
jgi:uncharacterized protein